MRIAVVLFNLGGPDSLENVQPFLRNLFSDPAIIRLPVILRLPLARLIATRRAPTAREIYAAIGGRSPILPQTEGQARALEQELATHDCEAKCFIAMRYWHPFAKETLAAVKMWNPDRVVLLPLYPQYSTTTTGSSLAEWQRLFVRAGLSAVQCGICCYPDDEGFVTANADLLRKAQAQKKDDVSYRVLFSAHGLPARIVAAGDPYPLHVAQSVKRIAVAVSDVPFDHVLCYQSRVGPLEWIGPATDEEIRRAGREGKGVIVVPTAFVSEHSETLVELDIEYRKLAHECGVADYIRVPAVGTHAAFIAGLGRLVRHALEMNALTSGNARRFCPSGKACAQGRAA